jgi:hypothetical protein
MRSILDRRAKSSGIAPWILCDAVISSASKDPVNAIPSSILPIHNQTNISLHKALGSCQ